MVSGTGRALTLPVAPPAWGLGSACRDPPIDGSVAPHVLLVPATALIAKGVGDFPPGAQVLAIGHYCLLPATSGLSRPARTDKDRMPAVDASVATGSDARGAAVPMPRRIAAVIASAAVSGPGRQLVLLATDLVRRGVDFRILALHRPGEPMHFPDFIRAQGIACEVLPDHGPLDPRVVRVVGDALRAWQPDIVQTHSYKATAVVYALRRLGLAAPWVAFFEGETDKGLKDRLYTRVEAALLPAADRIVVMSRLQESRFGRHTDHVRIVYNAPPAMTDAGAHDTLPAVLQRRRGSGPHPLIGVVGRLSHEKGVDVFIDSLALLRSRGVAVTAVVIGEGDELQALTDRARQAGVSGDIAFVGQIASMRAVYAALDLLVIPSRSEGLPSVLLEAMQQDLPVVSTRVGAMIEIAAEHPEALDIVAPERPDALADGIAGALGRLAAPERARARARVVSELSSERRTRRMLEIYGEARVGRGRA